MSNHTHDKAVELGFPHIIGRPKLVEGELTNRFTMYEHALSPAVFVRRDLKHKGKTERWLTHYEPASFVDDQKNHGFSLIECPNPEIASTVMQALNSDPLYATVWTDGNHIVLEKDEWAQEHNVQELLDVAKSGILIEKQVADLMALAESEQWSDSCLDDLVHDLAQEGGTDKLNTIEDEAGQEQHIGEVEQDASTVNNGGIEEQIRFLLTNGVTEAQITDAVHA